MSNPRVLRAMLTGAYSRRRTMEQRGEDTAEADERIAELEPQLSDEMITHAREASVPLNWSAI